MPSNDSYSTGLRKEKIMSQIETIETSSLGDRSYLAMDGEVAVVVDPQRGIDGVLDLVEQRGVKVTMCWIPTCTTTRSAADGSSPSRPARRTRCR